MQGIREQSNSYASFSLVDHQVVKYSDTLVRVRILRRMVGEGENILISNSIISNFSSAKRMDTRGVGKSDEERALNFLGLPSAIRRPIRVGNVVYGH